MGNRRSRVGWRVVAALAIVTVGGVGSEAGRAHACTCGSVDPVELVDDSEAVFLASATDHRDRETGFRTLRFQVDTVVKGQVPASFEISAGMTVACGPSYAHERGRHVVYVHRWREYFGLMACAPLVPADELGRHPGSDRLTLTPIDQVGYDVEAVAADFAELLETDRREYEQSVDADPDRAWANRLGLALVVVALVGYAAWIVRLTARP